MTPELLASFAGAGVGSAGAVWFVFRVMVAAIRDDVNDVKVSVRDSHLRIDKHLEGHS